ncbi:MAG: DUF3276 family protein [Candidatus Zixiibacteriota bacterium]
MTDEKKAIATERVMAGSKTYYLDLKLAKNDKKYLVINEARKGPDGKLEYSRVTVWEENIQAVIQSLQKIAAGL